MNDNDCVVGFRFYPTEEELLHYYLLNKLKGNTPHIDRVIPLVHIYDYNPWDLPKLAGEVSRGHEEQWFFFTPMQEREAQGGRRNRLTGNGYWKATGSPSDVYNFQNTRIGRKKTMVFYEGRAPTGRRTPWKMNEYKLYETTTLHHQSPPQVQLKEELSICRIYKRSKGSRAATFERRPPMKAAATHDEAAAQYYHQHLHNNNYNNSNAIIEEDVVKLDQNQDNINPVMGSEFDWDMATDETELLRDSDIRMLLNWFDV